MFNRIGLVHLSDTQFGRKHSFGQPSTIARGIADDIATLSAQHAFIPTYLLLSGDIAETGHGDEFRDAAEQTRVLLRQTNIEPQNLLAVPGNHDVSWDLAKVARTVGNPKLSLANYESFLAQLDRKEITPDKDDYPTVADRRNCILFILINSCEKETDELHRGFVSTDRLLRTFEKIGASKQNSGLARIAVLHHRLDTTIADPRSRIENAEEVEAILFENDVVLILTGHVHTQLEHTVTKNNKSAIYSGCGSTGVNHLERGDGIPNQYSVHILDWANKRIETLWRSFNPRSRTKTGLGAWVADNTIAGGTATNNITLPQQPVRKALVSFQDRDLESVLGITSNPFVYSNAEKIAEDLIFDLFISDNSRHANATRLAGDAIIRGPRGSGKTMLLRYLYSLGSGHLRIAFQENQSAECLPVLVNFSRIHRANLHDAVSAYSAAEELIFDSVLDEIDKRSQSLQSAPFKAAVHAMKQRLGILKTQAGTPISHLGSAIRDHLSSYFGHVLLLLDEVSPVFPREFFQNKESGFLAWMNSIRNSGPYWTRVAIYPNDVSDILNEERFGTIVNLEFDIRKEDEYNQFRNYAVRIVNTYLRMVSTDRGSPTTIDKIVAPTVDPTEDALEQLIYASDGSSRRFLSLMDRCLGARKTSDDPLSKKECLMVISEMANKLMSGYPVSEQEIAVAISKVARRNTTFRFRMPYGSQLLRSLHASREELNIIKLVEPRAGSRGILYEFTYPYCISMDIQTHSFRDSGRVCPSRDRHSAEWITRVTTIEKDSAELFGGRPRLSGVVSVVEGTETLIELADGRIVTAEAETPISVGDKVTLILGSDQTGFDIRAIAEPAASSQTNLPLT